MRWLKFHLLTLFRQNRYRARDWLEAHPRIKAFLERTGSLHVDEPTLARGVAMGLFIGLTPTVGIQTVLMLTCSVMFRANFIAAYIVSFVSNPFTMGPLYYGFHELGEVLLGWMPVGYPPVEYLEEEIVEDAIAMLLGSMAIAVPVAVLGYLVSFRLWRAHRERARIRREGKRAHEGQTGP